MNLLEIFIVSLALAADAFAISVCKGLSSNKISLKNSLYIAFMFGLFQMIMPFIGYFLGNIFSNIINTIDHYVAFILLFFIGINMIKESYNNDETINDSFSFKNILLLSIATSIDALSYGIVYSISYIYNYILCFIIIGIITFITSFIGSYIGNRLGNKFNKVSRIVGGIILIIIGFKILIEHLTI